MLNVPAHGAWRRVCVLLVLAVVAAAGAGEPRSRVLLLVDESVYPEIKDGLATYIAHVEAEFDVKLTPVVEAFYEQEPPAIRALLRKEHAAAGPKLVGAIMVGPIPYALRGDPAEIVIPAPLYYEDFDAQYDDANGDGVFQDSEITNDRVNNPTEIWTAWWVPPANDGPTQVRLLKEWLAKLDRYYRGEIVGRDQMLWLVGNVMNVEVCEGWTVLLKDTMQPLSQKLHIWCRIGQDEGTFRPYKRYDEFGPRDFIRAFTLRPWQHCHISAHGNQRGWYWDHTGVVAARRTDGTPEATILLDLKTLGGTAGNIVTTSGCGNGNFRGDYHTVAYDRSMGNQLLFSPHTVTIAYYGAASPQSTSGFAGYLTELVESLKSDGGSYLAEGYYRMRNHDYSWGTQHYFFRGGDEKILSGDPFARYRDSAAPTAEEQAAIQEKIDAGKWQVAGPW